VSTPANFDGARYPTAAKAYAALRAAGGTNYSDPCTGKASRSTFVVAGRVYGVTKRRGCDAKITDDTEYHSYWAGSATASARRMTAAGTWVPVSPLTSQLKRDRPAEDAAYKRDLAVFDA
jgi:hypothetical protein